MARLRTLGLWTALAAFLIAGCGGGGGTPTHPTDNRSTEQTVTVKLQPGVDPTAFAQSHNAIIRDSLPEAGLYELELRDATRDEPDAATLLQGDTRLLTVEVASRVSTPEVDVHGSPVHVAFDFHASFEPDFMDLVASSEINQRAYQQIHLGTAPSVTRGAGITVAVLDTGIDSSHPSLAGRLREGFNAMDPTGAPPDEKRDGLLNLAYGHGTMVAGVISRLAPEAKIMPIRVLNGDGNGSLLAVVRGIRWAMAHNVQVLNLSFGTTVNSDLLEDAVLDARAAGIVVVGAAGNAGIGIPDFPAATATVVGVAAIDENDVKALFSNFGSSVRISAPGVAIRSTYPGGGYASWSGTSFATPLVSAAIVLARSAHPAWSAETTVNKLLDTSRPLDGGNPDFLGLIGRGAPDVERLVLLN